MIKQRDKSAANGPAGKPFQQTLFTKFDELKKDITRTLRWYLNFIFGVILLMAAVVGWNASVNMAQGMEIKAIQENQRLIIKANSDEHPNNILLKYLEEKHSLKRGVTDTNEKEKDR